jgi:hypothetical protein
VEKIYPILITIATAALLISLCIRFARQEIKTGQSKPSQVARASASDSEKPKHLGPVCDICSQPLDLALAYFATTEQVVTQPAYWEVVFTSQWSYIHQMDLRGNIIGKLAERQSRIASTWGLCESCCQKLPIDQHQAREYALARRNPSPGAGPTESSRAAAAAAAAWLKLYGSFPDSVRFQ